MTTLPAPIEVITQTAGLVPFDEQVLKATQPSRQNPRISEYQPAELREFVKGLIKTANIKLGRKNKFNSREEQEEFSKFLGSQVDMICSDLSRKHGALTSHEVMCSLHAGLEGEFRTESDTVIYFSPSNLLIWIKDWIENVKLPVMRRVSDAVQKIEKPKDVLMIDIDPKTRLNDHFNILYAALQKVSAGQEFYDGGNIVWSLMKIADRDFFEIEEMDDETKKKNVKTKLDLIVSQELQASYLEDIRQGILNYLNNLHS